MFEFLEKYKTTIFFREKLETLCAKCSKFAFITCIIIGLIEIAWIMHNYSTIYDTNDDVFMMLLSRGVVFSKEPSELILYSNFIYGKYLVFFTKIFRQINFYAVNNIVLIFCALTLIRYSFLKYLKGSIWILFATIMILPFSVFLYTNLQFTILASLLFVAGLIALYTAIKLAIKPLYFFGGFAIILAGLIRYEQTIIISVFVFPFLIFLYLNLEEKKAKFLWSIVGLTFLGLCLYGLNSFYYSKVSKYDFLSPNVKIATLFNDYRVIYKVADADKSNVLKQLNLSQNDLVLYKNFYVSPPLIERAKAWDISQAMKSARSAISFNINKKIIVSEFNEFYMRFFLLSFAGILLLLFGREKGYFKVVIVLFLFIIYYVFLSQMIGKFLKPMQMRMFFSAVMSLFFISWLYYFSSINIALNKSILLLFSFVISGYSIKFIFNHNSIHKKKNNEVVFNNAFKNFFESLDPTKIYIRNSSVKILGHCDPFDNLNWLDKTIFPMGMPSEHPKVKECFPKLSSPETFDFEVVNNNKIRLLLDKKMSDSTIPAIKKYYKDKYNFNVNIEIDSMLNNSTFYNCYYFSKQN